MTHKNRHKHVPLRVDLMVEAYDGGAIDKRIASYAGCSRQSVQLWRSRMGLPANGKCGVKPKNPPRQIPL